MNTALFQNALNSLTGNATKAVLFVRQIKANDTVDAAAKDADLLRRSLNSTTASALSSGVKSSYSSIVKSGSLTGKGYLALELQYNPNTLYLNTQGSGRKIRYAGGNLGGEAVNQTVQEFSRTVSSLSCQLVFDDVNVSDAFMLENLSPTLGNAISMGSSTVKKLKSTGSGYSVQPQMEGLMSLLTQEITRQVIFFWSGMFFRGELNSVDCNYTMFNKSGDPVRGTADITISQNRESDADKSEWDAAFTRIFGAAGVAGSSGSKSTLSKLTNNNFLNLNL
ncbi:MAG: hypothetical protein LUC98_12025 [Lachnospiraceae bacterium]|nr:hypothetical protein [Lachnospiraceae bacterium]